MTRLIILRHGYSRANKEQIYSGQSDVPLEPEGIAQGKSACGYIAENFSVDAIFAIDLSRAVKTVQPLAEKLGLPIQKDPGFREVDVGDWVGVSIAEVGVRFSETCRILRETPHLARYDGGESTAEVYERVKKAFTAVAEENPGKTVVVGSHGGAIRMFLCVAMGVPLEKMNELPFPPNCSITLAEYAEGKWKLPVIGYREYLQERSSETGVQ